LLIPSRTHQLSATSGRFPFSIFRAWRESRRPAALRVTETKLAAGKSLSAASDPFPDFQSRSHYISLTKRRLSGLRAPIAHCRAKVARTVKYKPQA